MQTIYHSDGTVTYWSVYRRQWIHHADSVPDRELAAMTTDDRESVLTVRSHGHCSGKGRASWAPDGSFLRFVAELAVVLFTIACATGGPPAQRSPSAPPSSVLPTMQTPPQPACDYENLSGKEFVFFDVYADPPRRITQRFFSEWTREPDASLPDDLEMAPYVGMRGKLTESPVSIGVTTFSNYYVATLENCEKVYVHAREYSKGPVSGRPVRVLLRTLTDVEKQTGIYFLETLARAKAMVGDTIFVNLTDKGVGRVLPTEVEGVDYLLAHLEALEVLDAGLPGHWHHLAKGRPAI